MVLENGPLNLLGCSLMSYKIISDSRDKGPKEEEVNSTEGKIQRERNMSNMDERDEFKNFVQSILKGLQDISHNII